MTSTPHVLANGSFLQDWSNLGLMTVNDDWSSVPSIEGFRGDGLTDATGVDPQTVLAAGTTPLDVNANQTAPNTFTTGGVTEFELTNPAIALAGSGTADAPFLLIHLDTTNVNNASVKYKLRDLDGSTDDAVQQVALQYRVGNTGDFVNIPAGYVADASEGGTATKETLVSVDLPAAAMNQSLVQLRIITTNAPGNDEWIGIDDIEIAATSPDPGDALDLSTYVRIGRYNLPEPTRTTPPASSLLAQEVSAVTYNLDTDTLFVLGDEGTSIVQVSKTGQLIDSMTLAAGDFDDTEGLAYVGGGQFVLMEERERQANLFTYVPGNTLTRADVQSVKLGTTVGNIGLEGASFDPLTSGFIFVKENSPQGIFQTEIDFGAGTATNGSPTTENSTNLFEPALLGLVDIGDVFALANVPFAAAQGIDNNLLVLSQESAKVVETDRAGNVLSELVIVSDPDNPLSVVNQGFEGVVLDRDGLLYLTSEQGGGDGNHPQLWVYAPLSYSYSNAAPVAVSLANVTSSLLENADTTTAIKLANIIVSDDALGTNTFTLTGADADDFEIVGTELFLKAGTVLDFETQPNLAVTLEVDDTSVGNTPDAASSFTLAITEATISDSDLIISEVAPWSSGNSSVGADWFEVTNTGATAVNLTGWKIDDDSASFVNGSFLSGVTNLDPGQSAVFVDGDAATIAAFIETWFGGAVPNNLAIGNYGGPGLGTGGDAVNLFDAGGNLITGLSFGSSPETSPFATFDNADGFTVTNTLSLTGTNGAFSVIDVGEGVILTGSPGAIAGTPSLGTVVGIVATDANGAEANQNPGEFTILRTGDTSAALEIAYSLNGDAQNGTDYTAINPNTITIPVGASQVAIAINPIDDNDPEATESVTLTLIDSADYDIQSGVEAATVTIEDNDSVLADFDLQITEMWSGNTEGSDLTADWFEITNEGTDAWVAGEAPDLYYDDNSQDPTTADVISGLTQLNPGQAAIVVVGTEADAQTFQTVWGGAIDLSNVEVGYTDGAGLGANGDGVSLFVGTPGNGDTPVDLETYPAGSIGQSYDVNLAKFSVDGENGAVATAPNDADQAAIGSPGNQGAVAPATPIHDIQGAGHTSPLVGQTVSAVPGIVTAVDSNGFYLQDPNPDDDIATSEALFVFTGGAPTVQVGDSITVSGTVSEFTPGGASSGNLSTTQIGGNPTVDVLSSNNPLPTATILGQGGRELPTQIIDSDPLNVFNPTTDGIDFYESLEAMRVTAKDVVAVSSTNRFGEIYGVLDNGANATGFSQRGTINIAPDDFNPERVQIDEDTGIFDFDVPNVNGGAKLGDVTGVIGYNFGNFEIIPTEDFVNNIQASTLQPEVSTLTPGGDQLLLATYNVLNLDPNDADGDADIADGRFTAIADHIVINLNTPDIIGLQEVQDNSGSANDGVVSADVTLQTLVDEIATAGGPTYAFIDNTFIGDNTSGGQPGANIRTAFLYNPDRVELVEGSVQTVGSQADGGAFFETRLPLIADFTFNGETVTVVNNHFSSKGGSSPLFGVNQPSVGDEVNGNGQEDPAINGSLDQRRAQAQVVNDFVDSVLANNADANVVVLGDFNEFEFISPLEILAGDALNNLVDTLPDMERYSFIFEGNSQSLDHMLLTENLSDSALVDIVHVNTEFVDNAQRASDHDPILAQITFADPMPTEFTLELLHLADQEPLNAGAGLTDITGLSAVLNALKAEDLGNDGVADNTLILSSGDAIIPGLFYEASLAAYGSRGIADIQIQNELGVQAISFGNHEFDFGTKAIADLISGAAPGNILGADFGGTNFPYLSTNLDFSTDPNLAPLEIAGGQAPQANKVTSSTVIDVNGEKIGVVGATTPTLASISSPGSLGITPSPFGANPSDAELDALAAIIQSEVDELLAANVGMNKVVLLSHMQKLTIEDALATRLENVDIIVGGGSNTRLFDETDRIRPGDSNQGEYPKVFTNAGGTNTLLVNTDGSYKYLGRLVIDFDAEGNILPDSYDPVISGAYATDAQGVADLEAASLVDPEIQEIVDAIEAQIIATESNVFGLADVFLNGNRSGTGTADDLDGVRTQETNFGNLTADANLALAQSIDPTVVVSLKNGGGIRASIGQTIVPPGGTEAVRGPNDALLDSEGNVVKPEGGISENDIKKSLAFNNGLTLLTLTKAELVDLLEHGVSALPGVAGQFPQVAGVKFSFDPDLPVGDRLLNAGIFDQNDQLVAELVREGEIVGDASQEFRVVTLNFLAEPNFDANGNFIGGGDGYPFPNLNDPEVATRTNPVDLVQEGVQTGDAVFADDGTEQDALAEYLDDNFAVSPFDQADVGPVLDERIQNLNFREDTVLPDMPPSAAPIFGTPGRDELWAGRDFAGQGDVLFTGAGTDEVDSQTGGESAGSNRIHAGSDDDEIYVANGDRANGGSSNDYFDGSAAMGYRLSGGAGDDIFDLGTSGRALGGDGDDQFFVLEGGDNLLAGGAGADQFWLLTDVIPTKANIVTDFTQGVDVIGIANQGAGVNFNSLSITGNSIALNGDVFATLNGFDTTTLTAADFVFA